MKIAILVVLVLFSFSGCIQETEPLLDEVSLVGTKAKYASGFFQNTIWKSDTTNQIMDKNGDLQEAYLVVVGNDRHYELGGQLSPLEAPYHYWITDEGNIIAFHVDGYDGKEDNSLSNVYRMVQTRYDHDDHITKSDADLLLQLTLLGDNGKHQSPHASVEWERQDNQMNAIGRAYEQCFRARYDYDDSAWASRIEMDYGYGTCTDKRTWSLVETSRASYSLTNEGKQLPVAESHPVAFASSEIGATKIHYPDFMGQFDGATASIDALALRLTTAGQIGEFVVVDMNWRYKGGPNYENTVFGPGDWDALILFFVMPLDGTSTWIDYFHVKEGVPVPLSTGPTGIGNLQVFGPISLDVDWKFPLSQAMAFIDRENGAPDRVQFQYWAPGTPDSNGFISIHSCRNSPSNAIEFSLGDGLISNYYANRDYVGVKACDLGFRYR